MPRVPPDRVDALRQAFDAMLKDADFLDEIGKSHAEFGPMGGAALQQLIAETRNVSPAVLERARAAAKR
jgi:tripartite-type tricarboxylate transporter receptor subunit TctC